MLFQFKLKGPFWIFECHFVAWNFEIILPLDFFENPPRNSRAQIRKSFPRFVLTADFRNHFKLKTETSKFKIPLENHPDVWE